MELFPSLWVEKYKIKNEAGLPIEFDDHYFMRAFYDDMSPLQVMLKAPQIGATVAELVKTFYCAKKKGWDIIYTLPTQGDVNDMAGGKINRIIAQNPILLEWTKDHDTVEQKAVGENIIYYRGTWTTKQAMMVSSDLNVHDEVDASDSEVIQQYETRLQAKSDGRRWYFSHPSLVGMGVDVYWEQSDKKEWFITCDYCNKEQQLKWPDNINLVTRKYVCAYCQAGLSDSSRKYGKWIPTSMGIFSGYHISQLMCPWISADKIVTDWETKDKQYFWNYVLGLPYIGSENKIEPSIVLNNVNQQPNPQDGRVVIGVDTGLPVHYVCMNSKGVFFYKACEPISSSYNPYDELERLLKHFDRSVLIADQGGDLIGIRRLQAKFPGRVFLCYYRKDGATKQMIKWGEDEEYGKVRVDRNRMISLTVEHLREPGYIVLNGKREEWELFASHFGNIYRELVVQKEAIGKDMHTLYGNEYVWKRSGPDHFVHALIYALAGMDKYGGSMATVIKANDSFMKEVPIGSDVHGKMPVARVIKRKSMVEHTKIDF